MKRQFRIERLRLLERQWRVAKIAVRLLDEGLKKDPNLLVADDLEPADATAYRNELSATYLIRLFAEFETGLRDWWNNGLGRTSRPATGQLIDTVAGRRSIPDRLRDGVHAVREYRNNLVHEQSSEAVPINLDVARGHLCSYFSWLPLDWKSRSSRRGRGLRPETWLHFLPGRLCQ